MKAIKLVIILMNCAVKKEDFDSIPNEEWLEEEQQYEEPEENVNRQQ